MQINREVTPYVGPNHWEGMVLRHWSAEKGNHKFTSRYRMKISAVPKPEVGPQNSLAPPDPGHDPKFNELMESSEERHR